MAISAPTQGFGNSEYYVMVLAGCGVAREEEMVIAAGSAMQRCIKGAVKGMWSQQAPVLVGRIAGKSRAIFSPPAFLHVP